MNYNDRFMRILDNLFFAISLIGWLLIGTFGTWVDTAPFWLGAPLLWVAAFGGLLTIHWGIRGRIGKTCMISMILFAGYVIGRAWFSDVAHLVRQELVFALTAFIGWVLTAIRYDRPWQRHALVASWSILILGNLAIGIYQIKVDGTATPLSFMGYNRSEQDAAFGGFFPSSNHLAGFMQLSAFVALGIAIFGRVHSFVRILCGIVFVAGATCVALSTSRGGWIAFAAGMIVFAILWGAVVVARRGERPPGRRVAIGALLCILALALFGFFGWRSLEHQFGQGKIFENMNGRTEMWDRAYSQWAEAPVFGTGARSYEYFERRLRNMETSWIYWGDVDLDAYFAHNDWVQFLAEYGAVGLMILLFCLGAHMMHGLNFVVQGAHRSAAGRTFADYRGGIVFGALAGISAFAIHNIAEFNMHIGCNALLAAGVLGLLANPGAAEEDEESTPSVALRGWHVAFTTLSIIPAAWMSYGIFSWAPSDYHYRQGLRQIAGADSYEDWILTAGTMQKATAADPDNFDAWKQWGLADMRCAAQFLSNDMKSLTPMARQYYRSASKRFIRGHKAYPQHPYLALYAGQCFDYLGEYDEARIWLDIALQWGSGSRQVHRVYGDHLMLTKNYSDASVHYLTALHKSRGKPRELVQRKFDHCVKVMEQQRAKKDKQLDEREPAPAPDPLPPPETLPDK